MPDDFKSQFGYDPKYLMNIGSEYFLSSVIPNHSLIKC